jgi:tellurite methyltransferase
MPLSRRERPRLIDLGTGEGRDLVAFARHGFCVLGVDLSEVGLAKARFRAARLKLEVRTQQADIRTYRLPGKFEVVFSSGAVGNLPPTERGRRFAHFKDSTVPGGINAMNAFVTKPYLAAAPEMDPNESKYRAGELLSFYWDWQILETSEIEFDCNSSGIPHKHAMDVVIARRPL